MKILDRIPIVQAYRNRYEPESYRKLADIYWKMLVVITTMLLIGFLTYDLLQFLSVKKILSGSGNQDQGKNPLDVMPFNKEQVRAMTDAFIKRKGSYDLYSSQAPTIPDPSK